MELKGKCNGNTLVAGNASDKLSKYWNIISFLSSCKGIKPAKNNLANKQIQYQDSAKGDKLLLSFVDTLNKYKGSDALLLRDNTIFYVQIGLIQSLF